MELEAQPSNTSSPCLYATAPNSPNEHSRSMEFYYSAPASPRRKPGDPNVGRTGDDHRSKNLDDFEFETSKKFSGPLSVEMCENSESPVRRERGGSLPSMAFADELFLNGLVMPLKLPQGFSLKLNSTVLPEIACFITKNRLQTPVCT
ncbi:UNVERIFIED_CONTAM: hypothetical protein Sradi_1362800 [Sesamum radiatum]|uniref:Uncharacterized protein n=1 Tax=Sesamum radiatum TaxID=300843 RepID=A0AAW2USL3_SESRA